MVNRLMRYIKRANDKISKSVFINKVDGNSDICQLNDGVDKYIYATSPYIKHINLDDNIGEDGSNLTIMILTCDRVSSTIKLLDSIVKYIPKFKGYILLIDNASSKEQLEILKKKRKEIKLKIEIIEFSKNLGIAGGRQKGMDYVKTEWVMLLDNDIYFTINPLKKLQKDIALLGCHFINMPLMTETKKSVFTNGGNLYIDYTDKDNIYVNSGSVFKQGDCEQNIEFMPSLSTFIYGGSSVMKKETFYKCGGFDENMFIGFEDSDLSIRVFREGYKIGNCGILALVHDHCVPLNNKDVEYEKKRFSNERLKKSAEYFEKKNKFKVWNPSIEKWIKQRNDELKLEEK